jgi:apolipoprotein N-acyltransferase
MHAAVGRPGVAQRNRLHLIGPDGVERARYDKQVLTPFGEYVPTPWLGAWVRPLASASAPTTPGTGTNTVDLTDPRAGAVRRLGVLVCYETIYPWLARRAVRDGASVLVTPSNDAWFSHTAAPEQQLGHVALRAVADPFGRVTWSGRQSVPSWQLVTVALMGTTTAYARFGDWFAIACALLVGCVASPRGPGRDSKSSIAGVNGARYHRRGDSQLPEPRHRAALRT